MGRGGEEGTREWGEGRGGGVMSAGGERREREGGEIKAGKEVRVKEVGGEGVEVVRRMYLGVDSTSECGEGKGCWVE